MEMHRLHIQLCPPRQVRELLHECSGKMRALRISALLSLSMLASVGCQPMSSMSGFSKPPSAPPPTAFPITFAPFVSYANALEELTNLGLQPAVFCGYEEDKAAGRVITDLRWQPAGQRDVFLQEPRLFVARTPLAAPDWFSRVAALPGVQRNLGDRIISCPDAGAYNSVAAPSRTIPLVLTYGQLQRTPYARVEFTSATDYSMALYEVSNLGLRLADPCYEQAQRQGKTPPWNPMGQETAFAASRALVVAPAPLTAATSWSTQLRALPESMSVETPYTPTC